MTKDRRNQLWTVVYVLVLALIAGIVLKFGAAEKTQVHKVGFITTASASGDGWDVKNIEGVRAACSSLGVELLIRDNVPEFDGSCPRAVQELADEGVQMIILSSPGYPEEMVPLFSQYPEVHFYGIFASVTEYDADNVTSYSARMYQARYLSGIVAGAYSKNGKIGFVATSKSSEVCRNVDAFTMGARRMNPDAEVLLIWASEGGEEEAARTLIQSGQVDVITYHHNQHAVVNVAEELGVASIGYYDEAEGVSDKYLTCAACDWTVLYKELIREYLRGQSSSMVGDWLDLESGVVGLTECSSLVPQYALREIEDARQEILSGADVFTNEIYDNQGVLRCGPGEAMSDETLIFHLDWLVEGVRVYE